MWGWQWIINRKGCERKWWSNSRLCGETEEKNDSQDRRSLGRDLNADPPEFEAGVLTIRSPRLAGAVEIMCTPLEYSLLMSWGHEEECTRIKWLRVTLCLRKRNVFWKSVLPFLEIIKCSRRSSLTALQHLSVAFLLGVRQLAIFLSVRGKIVWLNYPATGCSSP